MSETKGENTMSSNNLQFVNHPALRTITSRLRDLWPEHRKYLLSRFRADDEARRDRDEQVAELALTLIGNDLDRFCLDYRWMCEAFTEEEIFFRRFGSYRLKTFAEVDLRIYSNASYMSRYVNGILMSQILWSNHATALDLFRTRYLPSLPAHFDHLEVGPGHGLFLVFATTEPRCATATAWDVSPTSIAATARALDKLGIGRQVILLQQDILHPAPQPGEFDSVIISEVLEHLEQPDVALRTLHESLRQGGSIFINVPINSPAPDHIFLWTTPEEVIDLISGAGFSVRETHLLPMTGYRIEDALKRRLSISCVVVANKQ
jgi:2-polyprenyl-3-methyl-5-hydroxy-6-metoxy-1,4-benzoquinol methylase